MAELNSLKAKDLKKIAALKGLEYDPMASAVTMLKLLNDAGITQIPEDYTSEDKNDGSDDANDNGDGPDWDGSGNEEGDGSGDDSDAFSDGSDQDEDPIKTEEELDEEAGRGKKAAGYKRSKTEYLVTANLKINGEFYKKDSVIVIEDKALAKSLAADGTIK
jgi:hypothetical protein